MADGFQFDWREFDEKVVRRAATSARGALPVMIEQGRGIIRGVISITPPGSESVDGATTKARDHGRAMIAADLLGGGKRNKHHRTGGIFAPMPRGIIAEAEQVHGGGIQRLWSKSDGTIYGVENDFFRPNATLSDLREHHKKYFRNGRMTRAGGATRDVGRWKFIDRLVIPEETFQAYLKEQQAKVGYLASGWRVAAKRLGISLPAWIANADGPSTALVEVSDSRLRIVATNEVSFASTRLPRRRIQWAIDRQTKRMEKQWNDWIEKRFK